MLRHFQKIANTPVRSAACWAGNLMICHEHDDFPSDIATMFAGTGATLSVLNCTDSSTSNLSMIDFLQTDMSQKIIVSVAIPYLSQTQKFNSFKVLQLHSPK